MNVFGTESVRTEHDPRQLMNFPVSVEGSSEQVSIDEVQRARIVA